MGKVSQQNAVAGEPTHGSMLVGHLVILESSVNEPWTLLDSTAGCVQILSNARVIARVRTMFQNKCWIHLNIILSNLCLFESTVNGVGKLSMNIVPCQSQGSLFKCKTEDKLKPYQLFLILEQGRFSVLVKNCKENCLALEPVLQ